MLIDLPVMKISRVTPGAYEPPKVAKETCVPLKYKFKRGTGYG